MESRIYIDKEKSEIDIFFGGKIGVSTDKGTLRENGKEHAAYSLCLRELEEAHDVGADLRDKSVKEMPFKIRLVFQDKDINSANVLIKCLEHIIENGLKSCTTK